MDYQEMAQHIRDFMASPGAGTWSLRAQLGRDYPEQPWVDGLAALAEVWRERQPPPADLERGRALLSELCTHIPELRNMVIAGACGDMDPYITRQAELLEAALAEADARPELRPLSSAVAQYTMMLSVMIHMLGMILDYVDLDPEEAESAMPPGVGGAMDGSPPAG